MISGNSWLTPDELRPATLVDLLKLRALSTPSRIALIELADGELESGRITFAELDSRARNVAAALSAEGLSGERVLLAFPSGIDYVVALWGCLYAGAIAVPAYPPTSSAHGERLHQVMDDCAAKLILVPDSLLNKARQRLGRLTDMPRIEALSTFQASAEFTPPDINPESIAYLQYTSGSTSNPKGVMVSHRNVLAHASGVRAALQHDQNDVTVTWAPLFHDLGLVMGVFHPIFLGGLIVMMPPVAFQQKPVRWLQAISRYRATTSLAPNFAYQLCVDAIPDLPANELDLGCWRVAINGAEPVRESTLVAFARRFNRYGFDSRAYRPGYGMAESTLAVAVANGAWEDDSSVLEVDPERLELHQLVPISSGGVRLVSNGPALDRTEICIVDIERARRIPDGRIGEIWICGPTVAKGYWKRSSESDTTFRARLIDGSGPFLRTGDLGAIVDGRLYITGRQKDLVIIRGRNLYPDDIERVVAASNPTVLAGNGVAFSVDGESGERLVIVQEVERTERHRLDGAEVTKEIRARIVEEFGVEPGAVILVRPASVPVTSSGKKQRSACREKYLAGEISALFVWKASEQKALPAASAPMSTNVFGVDEIVTWLRHKLAVTCGREIAEVSITEPFATQGLDSLKLVALSGELATWMARPVDPVEMFDYPSIASLAKHLAGAVAETSASSSVDIAIPPPAGEPIAIIGMACRFPGSDNLSRFRDLLFNGRDAISPLPDGRWPDSEMAVEGGFVSDVDLFDPLFFGITPREAEAMDPQQRLLLLTAWHALEDAGLPPDRLAGTRTGVFVGISTHDYLSAQIARSAALDGHTGTGSAMSVAANRISYLLDLHGPSFVVDTACSSSLVAIHQARNTLRNGECDIAIVAGVNLMLHPDLTEIFKQAGMMAADFRCKSFDASANGYVRGEGCGVVVLCRQSDAVRRRSRIYAELVGSAINQDGRSNGLTAPNGLAQQSVIRDALKSAGVDAAQVGYVETHGTGTPLGDPIEVAALRAVYDREGVTRPLWLGAVKTQIGHLEAAAGIAGLIKTCMVLHQGKIPGNLHLQTINPKINLDGSRLRLPRQVERWDGTDIRYAGVSSFGFGGSNAHVVLRSVNSQEASLQVALPNLFILSAHDERALQDLVQQVVHDWNRSPLNVTELAELCRASQVQRTLLATRLVVICRDPEQAHAALSAYAEGGGHEDLAVGESGVAIPQSPLAFLFTGMGANHVSMGRGLYDAIPTFRIALDRVDAALHPYLNRSIRELFTTSDAEAAIWLEKPHIAQPALFALEYALAHVWIGLLGKPDVVAGHSFGEYTAACIAGLWSVDEAARVIAIRAHLIETLALPGGMVAIRAAPAALEHLISALPDNGLSLAAVNSPEHITVSGEMPSLNKWIEDVAALGGRVTWSESGYAYHSTLLLPMVDEFGSTLEKIRYETPLIPVINHFTGKEAGAEIREPAYWQHHLLEPVHFFDGVQALARMNVGVFVEVGPHPILLNHTRTALPDAIRLASGRREESGISALLNSIAQAVTSGLAVNFSALYGDEPAGAPPTRLLPLYPFARERYWFRADRSRVGLSRRTAHPLLGEKLSLAGSSQTHYQSYLPGGADLGLADHRINGQSVLPATALIDWFLATRNPSWEQSDVWSLTNLSIECMTVLAEETGQFLQTIVSVQEDEVGVELYRRFETEEEWRRVASARWSQVEKGGEHSPPVVQSFADSEPGSNLYQLLRSAGLEYGSTFARVSRFGQQDGSWWAELAPVNPEHKDAWVSDPFTLDAALHIIASAISDKSIMPAAPVELASFRLTGSLSGRLFAVVRRCDPMVDGVIADVVIQDEVGREAAYFGGLRLQRLVPAEARQIQWIPSWKSSKSSGSPAPGRCLVVGATRTVAPVAAALAELDQIAITINWDEEAQGESESDSLPPNSKPSWPTLDHHMTEGGGAIDTVVYVVPTFAHLDPAQRYLRQGRCLVSLSRLALIGLGQVSRLILISDGSPANEFTPALAYGRALYSEFKDLQVVHVSSTDKLTSMSASSLYTLMRTSLATTTTTEYRLHGENLSVRTLEPQADSSTKFSPRAGATYLITGGLGALGSMLVRELVARGADHVMLCGRSSPDSTAITSLNTEGVRIGYCQADVTDISEVNDMLMEIDRGWPPLAGVFHSAGLTDDAVLTSLDWSRYARVLAPKVQGAWNLHTATKDRALEVFVLFSSMASLIGSAGQANYAMANGFLDALAEHRQRHGLPVLTINWGPWSGDGMAADYGDHFARMGVHLLEPQVAMEQLFHALAQDSPQLLIADVKWPQFLSQRGTRVADQLLASFASQAEPPAQATPLLDVVELAKLPPKDAKGAIFDALFQRTVRILRIPATQQTSFWKRFAHARLNQLGFDSLMALELRNQLIADLGVQVPVRHFVGGSTAVAVVELIFEQAVLKALVSNDGDLSIAGEREEITI